MLYTLPEKVVRELTDKEDDSVREEKILENNNRHNKTGNKKVAADINSLLTKLRWKNFQIPNLLKA